MFYFVKLTTFLAYGIGVSVVAGGSYATWYLTTSFSKTDVDEANKPQALKNNTDIKIDKELLAVQKTQENIAKLKEQIDKFEEAKRVSVSAISSLENEIRDLESEKLKIVDLLVEAEKNLAAVEKKKNTQDALVTLALEEQDKQAKVVEAIKSRLSTTLYPAVTSAQESLNQALITKNTNATKLFEHEQTIEKLGDQHKQNQTFIEQLKDRQTKNQNDITQNTADQSAKEREKTTQVAEIESIITNRINVLNRDISNLNREIGKLTSSADYATKQSKQKEIDAKTHEKNELDSLKSQTPPYSSISTTSNIKTDLEGKSKDLKQLNEQHTKLITEKDWIEKQIAKNTTTNIEVNAKKTNLITKTQTLKDQTTTSDNNYNTKLEELNNAQQNHAKEHEKLKQEEQTLNSKKLLHDQEQVKKTQIDNELKGAQENEQELKNKQKNAEKDLKNKKDLKIKEEHKISDKDQEIKIREERIANIQQSNSKP